jgi:ABC-type hemin transport system substrate-binding protein
MYPERIVCLTEETTQTLYLLGEGHRVAGISGYTLRPPEARSKPKVSTYILQPGPAALSEGVRRVHERLALSASGAHSTVTFDGISRLS